MVRTQVSFTKEEYEYLRQKSRRTGRSVAALTRELVEQDKGRGEQALTAAISMLGALRDPLGIQDNVSEDHDAVFARSVRG